MKPNDMCNITNRSAGVAAYYLPETNKLRQFFPKETKKVPYSEIEAVSAQPGGRELLYHYFYIDSADAVTEALNVKPEPEYYLKEADIDSWMNSCSLDEFKDALDFAPEGIKALIKEHAVSLPLNDLRKCEAIKEQLGFNCLRAIQNEQETLEDSLEEVHATQRRVNKPEETVAQTDGRRTLPKYNVVKRDEK